jgi:hypothetical protein
MDINQDSLINTFLSQLFPFLFSFLDDAFFLGLSRLGIHIQSLQWLSSLILSYTIIYWVFRLLRYAFSPTRLGRYLKPTYN